MTVPSVFVSYSHKDENWKDRLRPHLRMLEQAGRLTIWDDRNIDAAQHGMTKSKRQWKMRSRGLFDLGGLSCIGFLCQRRNPLFS